MMIPLVIPKRASSCKRCGKKYSDGEVCFSTLFREEEGWKREDVCSSCEPAKGEATFRTKLPSSPEKVVVDTTSLFEKFQQRMENEEFVFAYLLGHLIARQKGLVLKKEPYDLNGKRGALFQDTTSELLFFVPINFSLTDLAIAKEALKDELK